jgi:hypothetical protein
VNPEIIGSGLIFARRQVSQLHVMSSAVQFNTESAEASRTCQILILCEDMMAYERARDVCWRILVQLADDLDFSFNCWNFYELSDANCAHNVMRSAKSSDVILLSMHEAALPSAAEEWLDALADQRLQAEGLLALVLNEPSNSPAAVGRLVQRLEQAARKLGMDFLSMLHPPLAPTARPAYGERLADHWGLNE